MLRLRPRLGLGTAALAALLCVCSGSREAAAAPAARFNHTMSVLADGNTLVVGGQNTAGTPLATVGIYISTGAKWETRSSLSVARTSHTATVLPDGRLLIAGGVSNAASAANCNSDGVTVICRRGAVFDPVTDAWTNTGNEMDVARLNHTATLLPSGKVLITGGQTDAAGSVTTDCDLYNPATNNFEACGTGVTMQMARGGHTATLLDSGKVFVAGGYRAIGSGFAPTTEIYNPATDSWTSGPALIQARAYHSATQMGNQRVLIAGGYNARNVKENLGILETVEIYDANSNTIAPGAPMAERKLFHTANLLGTGNVDVYGGLGNITTSYFSQSLTLQPNSVLGASPADASTWLEATASAYATSDLRVLPDTILSVNASGIMVDGYIDFSSPVVQGTQFKADLDYPAGTRASLAAAAIDAGKLKGQTFSVTTIGGKVHFNPQDANADDLLMTAGSGIPNAGGLAPAVVTAFTNATIIGNLRIKGMPKEYVNGSVIRGRAIIKAGTITKASDDAVQGYDVTLDSGIATINGAVVLNDPTDGPVLILNNVTFSSVSGDITSSTSTTNVQNPINLTALKVTGLQLQLLEIVSPLQVADLTFNMDIATIVVRNMIFADQERYQPNQNVWQFGVPGDSLFSHAETLLPNGDEFVFGGRLCTSFANCGAYSFTAQSLNFAYILQQQGNTPWTGVGDLSVPRSNHSLTLLPDGRVLAAGGADASNTLNASEVMNATTHVWSRTADMKQRRSHHTAALLPNGNVLVAGGFTALTTSTGTTNHAEIFYPGTNTWVPTAPMISSRAYAGLVLLPDGSPFVMGGFANGAYLSSTEIFYSTGHRWVAGPSMPEARAQYTATLLRDGRIMVTGGLNAVSGVLNSTRFYDPATNTWSSPAGTNLNIARHSHTATMLRDGRVLVMGGNGGTGEIAQAEIFDPTLGAAGQWQRVDLTLGGNDLGIPRLGHTATLLPDGKVMIVGGFTALGGPIIDGEGFDVDFSSFQMQGKLNKARGDHATLLMKDGYLLTTGGFDGLNYTGTCEIMYGGGFPDAVTLAGGYSRRPRVDDVRPAIFSPGASVSAIGTNFKGVTEASGGGAAMNSSHPTPRVWLQRYDSASNSANDSGWQVDLGSSIARAQNNSWANMDSSITFTVPYTSATLPLGWYGLRVSAHDQFSVASSIQVGPKVPTGTPGVPSGVAVGPSSVVWTWAAAGGSFDGYSVYSATNGIFLSTVAASGGATETFLQTGLGPDTSSLIQVAAYNISGDGQVVVATVPVLTTVSALNGLQGIAQNERTIFWSWDPITGATRYDVYSASAGVFLSSPTAASFTQTNLSTNAAYGIAVRAILPGGPGTLSSPATAYTLAAVPTPGSPGINFISTGSVVAQWLPNSNPNTTRYHVKMLVGTSTDVVHISSIQANTAGITGLTPNTLHQLSVAAFNGDGKYTSFVSLGSTYTFARPPSNAVVTHVDPSGLSIQWDPNGNPGDTPYQILYSTDNFATNISTYIAFSANYTTASANVGPLITSVLYTVRITARNSYGQETSAASTQAVTDNGGGPAGSLSILVPTTVYTTLSGTLGSGRRLDMRVPAGTFSVATRIFISSRALADLHCGNIAAGISITTLPPEQPRYPVEVGLQYDPAEANIGSMNTLGMTRYDPITGACVPMQSRNDQTNHILYADLNHFSDFQLTQLSPSASVETARVFPNPLYTRHQPFFTFDHVPAGSRVRVYTIHGEEVFDEPSNASGVVTWRAENKVGRPVASGIYLAVLESGGGKKILKLAVVR